MSSSPTAHVIAFSDLHDSTRPESPGSLVAEPFHPLHRIPVVLQVCVGESRLTVGELMALRVQQLLVLDQALEAPVDLMLEGKVVARGQLVAVDECFGVRVTELPVPLRP